MESIYEKSTLIAIYKNWAMDDKKYHYSLAHNYTMANDFLNSFTTRLSNVIVKINQPSTF